MRLSERKFYTVIQCFSKHTQVSFKHIFLNIHYYKTFYCLKFPTQNKSQRKSLILYNFYYRLIQYCLQEQLLLDKYRKAVYKAIMWGIYVLQFPIYSKCDDTQYVLTSKIPLLNTTGKNILYKTHAFKSSLLKKCSLMKQ